MTFCLGSPGPKPHPAEGEGPVPSAVTHGNAKLLLHAGSINEIQEPPCKVIETGMKQHQTMICYFIDFFSVLTSTN